MTGYSDLLHSSLSSLRLFTLFDWLKKTKFNLMTDRQCRAVSMETMWPDRIMVSGRCDSLLKWSAVLNSNDGKVRVINESGKNHTSRERDLFVSSLTVCGGKTCLTVVAMKTWSDVKIPSPT